MTTKKFFNMLPTNRKLALLQNKLLAGQPITIMIIGLGSVGCYLLDYLLSLADPQLKIVVVGRNREKMLCDVNIARVAADLRGQLRSSIVIESDCDLNNIASITTVLQRQQPDFIVNSSRAYAGVKYGSVSWHNFRAYGIWAPLSMRFAKNIMLAYQQTQCTAITINTSYSDAVIPWLKSAGLPDYDFGSGNLNHLIPRMRFHIAQQYGIADAENIDITLAVSHFHDVVISKEGHTEGEDILVDIRYKGEKLAVDIAAMCRACAIAMPTDQKRNQMNASSNFRVITSILHALRLRTTAKLHIPGFDGMIGGYPVLIDGEQATASVFDQYFTLEAMQAANRQSIYHDGIEGIVGGRLIYTDELRQKVNNYCHYLPPKSVATDEVETISNQLIEKILLYQQP